MQRAQMIWLLMQIAGLDLAPDELARRAACYCFTPQQAEQVSAFLLCEIASAAGA
jgi:hypothetical protein